jgi:pimeloyl-ACP methyl ester carboxylesterase
VSLIGWSLGGIYARELAKLHPALARCVVTLGTPFTGHPKATNAWRIYELLSGSKVGDAALMEQIRTPPPVPTTSIYSRSDGIVSWRCSLNEPGALVENIEVPASHVGMGANPFVLYAVADRLAQPIGRWQPFEVSGARRWFFRTALPEAMATAG